MALLVLATGVGTVAAQPVGYEVIDLGTLTGSAGDETRATALNDLGQVTGSAFTAANRAGHAFFYSGGVLSDLGTLRPGDPVGAYFSLGTAINNAGQVVGQADNVSSRFGSFISQGTGPMTDLAVIGGADLRRPAGINDAGVVVGASLLNGLVATWSAGSGLTELTALGAGSSAAINASGQIAGTGARQAFLTDATGTDTTWLGTLGGQFSRGQALNASGQVTGASTLAGDASTHAFFFDAATGLFDMGTLGGSFSEGTGINDHGQVVGRSDIGADPGVRHAFVSGVNGVGLFDLNWFVSLDAGRYLTEAVGINRWGQIIANDNAGHAFLLSPVPEPETWAMLLLALVVIGGQRGLQRRLSLRPKG